METAFAVRDRVKFRKNRNTGAGIIVAIKNKDSQEPTYIINDWNTNRFVFCKAHEMEHLPSIK